MVFVYLDGVVCLSRRYCLFSMTVFAHGDGGGGGGGGGDDDGGVSWMTWSRSTLTAWLRGSSGWETW